MSIISLIKPEITQSHDATLIKQQIVRLNDLSFNNTSTTYSVSHTSLQKRRQVQQHSNSTPLSILSHSIDFPSEYTLPVNRKGSISLFPTSITQNTSNIPTTPSILSTRHKTWRRQSLSSWHSFSTVFLLDTNHTFFMATCSLDFLFSTNNTTLKLLFTTQWSHCISRSSPVFKFVVIFRTIVILENCNIWWADNRRVKDWLLHWLPCNLVIANCVIASLYYSLHNDTLPKPNRGDTSSLSSIDW